jgi:hypothetical protein
MKITKCNSILACLYYLATLLATCCDAQEFSGTGSIKSTSYKINGEVASQNEYTFDFALAGDKWFLRTVDLAIKKGTKAGQLSRETGCDGYDTFTKLDFSENALKSFFAEVVKTNKSRTFQIDTNITGEGVSFRGSKTNTAKYFLSMGNAYPGTYPENEDYFGKIVWFAILSGNYLPTIRSNNIPSLLQDLSINSSLYQRLTVNKWTSSELKLPIEAELHDDGIKAVPDRFTVTRTQLLPPFDKGFLSGEYRALEMTNLLGVTVPIQFEFNRYTVVQNQKKAFRYLSNKLIGTLTYHEIATRTNMIPVFDSPTLVTDQRFGKRGVRYRTEQGAFVDKKDPVLVKNVFGSRATNREPIIAKYLVAIIAIALAIAPLVYLTKKHVSKTKKHQTK